MHLIAYVFQMHVYSSMALIRQDQIGSEDLCTERDSGADNDAGLERL